MAAHTPQSHAMTAHTGSITSTNITDVAAFSQSGTYASLRAQATTYGDVGALTNSSTSEQTASVGELRVQNIGSTEKFTIEYNETDDTLDFVFASS